MRVLFIAMMMVAINGYSQKADTLNIEIPEYQYNQWEQLQKMKQEIAAKENDILEGVVSFKPNKDAIKGKKLVSIKGNQLKFIKE